VGRWGEWKAVGSYGTVGLEVVLSILLGLFGGRWLDGKFGTAPWLMLLGLVFGVGAAVRSLLHIRRQMQREIAEDGWKPSDMDRPEGTGRRKRRARKRRPGGSDE
jgi:F0F1-type ATP synthase assembly protein I